MLTRSNPLKSFISWQLPEPPRRCWGSACCPHVVVSRLARCWPSRSASLSFNQHLIAFINCHAFDAVACVESERGRVGPGWVKTDMTGGSGLITTAQARPYPQRVYRAVYAACHRPAQFISASRMDPCMVPQIVSGLIWGRPTDAELLLQASEWFWHDSDGAPGIQSGSQAHCKQLCVWLTKCVRTE